LEAVKLLKSFVCRH